MFLCSSMSINTYNTMLAGLESMTFHLFSKRPMTCNSVFIYNTQPYSEGDTTTLLL